MIEPRVAYLLGFLAGFYLKPYGYQQTAASATPAYQMGYRRGERDGRVQRDSIHSWRYNAQPVGVYFDHDIGNS